MKKATKAVNYSIDKISQILLLTGMPTFTKFNGKNQNKNKEKIHINAGAF